MTTKARKLFVRVQGVIMRMLCQKNVFLAIRIVVHARDNSLLPVLLVRKEIF
jgi:hypothetical protein